MSQRNDDVNPHQLAKFILACDSRDEIHRIVAGWLQANPPTEALVDESDSPVCLGSPLHAIDQEASLTDAGAEAIFHRRDQSRVFILCARPRTAPTSLDPLAVYSRRDLAERWISVQDPALQEVLEVHPWPVDEHPTDDYWAKPD